MSDSIVVFTSRSSKEIVTTGGSQAWRLRPANAKGATYLVCARNRKSDRNEGKEEHGAGFLIAKISGVVPSPKHATRFMIEFEEWAEIKVPGLWQFGRNPVHYTNLAELGIDLSAIKFKRREGEEGGKPKRLIASGNSKEGPLTIAEAKRKLAAAFGVNAEAVEITIRG